MIFTIKKYYILMLLISVVSCTSVSESDLTNPIPVIDITTYIEHVAPIINENCVVCHNSSSSATAPFPLETYEEVRSQTEDGTLLDRIQLPDGAGGIMPVSGRMPQNKIDIILAWVNDGFLEE